MMLTDGFHDVPKGKLAMVVTHLEMRQPPPLSDSQLPDGVAVRRVTAPTPDWYRDIFSRVGALEWLWFSRLTLSDKDLSAILTDPAVEICTLQKDGKDEALLELDFRQAGACELAFLGLTRALIGTGSGRWLINHAIARAWSHPISRFHVHTCTLDHPGALGFYQRSGFTAISQQIEIAPDARLTGKLPRTAGPHVPILE